jgi:hypothetical protein
MGEWKMSQFVFPFLPWGMGQPPPPHQQPGLFYHRPQVYPRPPDPFNENIRLFGQAVGHNAQQHQNQQHQDHIVENGRLQEQLGIMQKENQLKLEQAHLEKDAGQRVLNGQLVQLRAKHDEILASKKTLHEEHDRIRSELDGYKNKPDAKMDALKKQLLETKAVLKYQEMAHKHVVEAFREVYRKSVIMTRGEHEMAMVPLGLFKALGTRISSLDDLLVERKTPPISVH